MKLSEHTLAVLKNFANINSGVVLRPGKIQRTMSLEETILVEAELDEKFDDTFGIYDLNQFIGNVMTLNAPELDFKDKTVEITDGAFKLNYFACDQSMVKSPPEKGLSIGKPEVTFSLSQANLAKLLKLATMNVLPHLSVVGKNKKLTLKTHDKENDTSNSVSVEIGDWVGPDFVATFKTETLKLLPDDYEVEIKLGAFARFTAINKKINYFIALHTK